MATTQHDDSWLIQLERDFMVENLKAEITRSVVNRIEGLVREAITRQYKEQILDQNAVLTQSLAEVAELLADSSLVPR